MREKFLSGSYSGYFFIAQAGTTSIVYATGWPFAVLTLSMENIFEPGNRFRRSTSSGKTVSLTTFISFVPGMSPRELIISVTLRGIEILRGTEGFFDLMNVP